MQWVNIIMIIRHTTTKMIFFMTTFASILFVLLYKNIINIVKVVIAFVLSDIAVMKKSKILKK